MSTSLVHLGDFHAAPGPRNADRYHALDQVIDAGIALPRLGGWLWPGDLNHARMSIEDRNALASRLQRMARHAPVLICYGNHDLTGDLDVFARLSSDYPITVVDRPGCVRVRLTTGEFATVFVLRYPTKAGLTSMGIAPADVIDAAADALDGIFLHAAGELEAARAQGDLTLMIGHVNVGGAVTSPGQPNIAREIELSSRHLDRLGNIYKGLNHIHKGQEIYGAWYPGSICRLDWGEIEEKRWLEITYRQDSEISPASEAWVYDVVSNAIDVPPMYHVDGKLTRAGFDWRVAGDSVKLLSPGASAPVIDFTGCEVRVRYEYLQSEKTVLNHESVKAPFVGARLLQVEGIAVPDRALRAPAVAAARTLPEKLQAWADVAGVTTSERILEKLARLEHRDPLQLLSEIQTHLAAVESADHAEVAT